jgi:mannose-6-phosphate isomerase
MWYVMQADKGAELIVGFDENLDKEDYNTYVVDGSILEVMHHEKVVKGDTFYIPTGRVHAIGAGVLLAEIQQTSNITYRIYDYDRVDSKTGEKRELHTEMALDAIDFEFHDNYKTKYETQINSSNKLVHSPYFKTNIINVSGTIKKDYSELDSFVIYMCVEGELKVVFKNESLSLKKGETLLLPSVINEFTIEAVESKLLEVYIN